MTTEARSRTGRQLAKAAAAAGWTVRVTPGAGHAERSRLGDPRGDGTRPRITEQVPCESEGIRLRSPDRTHNAVAVLLTLDGKSWTSDGAWGWNTGQVPRPIDVRSLLAYLKSLPAPDQHDTEREAAA